jgi:hypothetical protein
MGSSGNSSLRLSASENPSPTFPDSTSTPSKSSRCRALTKAGKPCQAAATKEGLCYFHANPEKASELGRIGGRKNHRHEAQLDPLPKLDSAGAICSAIGQLAEEVHSGKLNPKMAGTLVQLTQLLLRALPAADVEKERQRVKLPDDF